MCLCYLNAIQYTVCRVYIPYFIIYAILLYYCLSCVSSVWLCYSLYISVSLLGAGEGVEGEPLAQLDGEDADADLIWGFDYHFTNYN